MSEVIGMLGYGMIRTIFWILVTVLLLRFTILRKKKLYKILTVIVCIVGLNTLSAQFPIENLFFSFKSPESAFQYYHGGKMVGNIVEVVEGKSSSMVVFIEDNSFIGRTFITLKTEKGFKIPSWFTVEKHTRNLNERKYGPFIVDITIYRVVDTNDYFYYGSIITEEGNVSITDSNNVNVKHFYRDDTSFNSSIIFYGYVENLTGEYHFLIGDHKVSIDEQLKPGYNEK
jgi:hypothetical protein